MYIMFKSTNIEAVELLGEVEALRKSEYPLYLSRVPAGFPSPADDYIDKKIDLNEALIKHPAAAFLMKIAGHSMIGAGIHSGDMLIVDRSVKVINKAVIVAVLNGEFTVKYFIKLGEKVFLEPANSKYKTIEITSTDDFEVWGVVVHSLRSHVRSSRLQ